MKERAFNIPSSRKSGCDHASTYLEILCQFRNWGGLSLNSKHAIVAFIAGLLLLGGPLDVSGKVTFGVSDSVNASSFGALSNFSKEHFKRLDPTWIDSDSAPAVVRVVSIVWVGASLD